MTDWPIKTLGDICRIDIGRTPSRGDSKGWDKAFKTTNHWASIADLTACSGRVLTSTKERISDLAAKTTKVVPAGTLMMSFKLSIGKLAFAGCDLHTNEAIAAFHLHEQSNVDSEFLYWALSVVDWSALTKGSEKVKGATMNKAKLNLLEIPVPPLNEQKRIVELLGTATARITELTACYEQAQAHANNLFTSALRDALESNLGWPVKTLGEMLELSYGKPLDTKDRDVNGLVPVYGANGVKAYSKKSLVAGPSIIVGRKGSAGELKFCEGPFWPLDVTYYVEHDANETDLSFLHYLLSLMDLPSLAKGVKPGINRNDVYALRAAKPPLDEQKRIVAQLDSMRAKTSEMVAAYDAKLTAAKNLRQSILEAAFAGEL
jgi:type I restriction enzyme S subunit